MTDEDDRDPADETTRGHCAVCRRWRALNHRDECQECEDER